jgi:Fe-S-cluster-containing hydrogenase component 2
MNFLIREGLGEATNVLIIDESLCIGCDNCEKACAETHAGISRLDRKSGPTFAAVHIPTACRHCEQPHCMKDCPPNAIRRAESGEVYINESCIGCGNCVTNCPYDVIRLEYDAPEKPGMMRWMLFGSGPRAGSGG